MHSIEEWAREIGKTEARGRREATTGINLENDSAIKAEARGGREATAGVHEEEVQPLVLREAPMEGVAGLIIPPCPPSSLASPTGIGES